MICDLTTIYVTQPYDHSDMAVEYCVSFGDAISDNRENCEYIVDLKCPCCKTSIAVSVN